MKLNDDTRLRGSLQTLAEERGKVYWFLAEFYNVKPTIEFIRELKSRVKSVEEIDRFEGLAELKRYLDNFEEEDILSLQVLFTRLMRGIRKGYSPPPPFESVYRGENRVCGEWTMKVMKFYADCGFGIIDETVGPQDHITSELKFMSMMCMKESEGWKFSPDEAFKWLRKEKDFLKYHVLQWVPRFCEIIRRENDGFYSSIAKLTVEWIDEDFKHIEETIERDVFDIQQEVK